MRLPLLFVLILIAVNNAFGQATVPAGSRVFIAPMDGNLDGFIAPEIIKKKLPVRVVTDEKDADYVLTGASIKADDKWYHTIFGGKDKNEGNVRLISVKDRQLVWAGEAGDRSLWWGGIRRGGQRKVADRIVKDMKKALFSGAAAQKDVAVSPVTASTGLPQNPASSGSETKNGLIEVAFLSDPPNALVYIGGMAIGRTPFTTKLPSNMYKATFSADGYFSSIQEVTVAPGYPTTVNATLQASSKH